MTVRGSESMLNLIVIKKCLGGNEGGNVFELGVFACVVRCEKAKNDAGDEIPGHF